MWRQDNACFRVGGSGIGSADDGSYKVTPMSVKSQACQREARRLTISCTYMGMWIYGYMSLDGVNPVSHEHASGHTV